MGGDELAPLRRQRAYLLADGRVQRLQLGDVGRGVRLVQLRTGRVGGDERIPDVADHDDDIGDVVPDVGIELPVLVGAILLGLRLSLMLVCSPASRGVMPSVTTTRAPGGCAEAKKPSSQGSKPSPFSKMTSAFVRTTRSAGAGS